MKYLVRESAQGPPQAGGLLWRPVRVTILTRRRLTRTICFRVVLSTRLGWPVPTKVIRRYQTDYSSPHRSKSTTWSWWLTLDSNSKLNFYFWTIDWATHHDASPVLFMMSLNQLQLQPQNVGRVAPAVKIKPWRRKYCTEEGEMNSENLLIIRSQIPWCLRHCRVQLVPQQTDELIMLQKPSSTKTKSYEPSD